MKPKSEQVEALLAYLADRVDMVKFVRGRTEPSVVQQNNASWREISVRLNGMGGVLKTPDRWKKFWNLMRRNYKPKKADYSARKNGGEPSDAPSSIDADARIASLMDKINQLKRVPRVPRVPGVPGNLSRKIRKVCQFKYCESQDDEVNLYRFPFMDKEACRLWIIRSGNESLVGMTTSCLKKRRVCEKHFSPNTYCSYTKTLLPRAIPAGYTGKPPDHCISTLPAEQKSFSHIQLRPNVVSPKVPQLSKKRARGVVRAEEDFSSEEYFKEESMEACSTSDEYIRMDGICQCCLAVGFFLNIDALRLFHGHVKTCRYAIKEIFQVEIPTTDTIQVICNECEEKLQECNRFKHRLYKSQMRLQSGVDLEQKTDVKNTCEGKNDKSSDEKEEKMDCKVTIPDPFPIKNEEKISGIDLGHNDFKNHCVCKNDKSSDKKEEEIDYKFIISDSFPNRNEEKNNYQNIISGKKKTTKRQENTISIDASKTIETVENEECTKDKNEFSNDLVRNYNAMSCVKTKQLGDKVKITDPFKNRIERSNNKKNINSDDVKAATKTQENIISIDASKSFLRKNKTSLQNSIYLEHNKVFENNHVDKNYENSDKNEKETDYEVMIPDPFENVNEGKNKYENIISYSKKAATKRKGNTISIDASKTIGILKNQELTKVKNEFDDVLSGNYDAVKHIKTEQLSDQSSTDIDQHMLHIHDNKSNLDQALNIIKTEKSDDDTGTKEHNFSFNTEIDLPMDIEYLNIVKNSVVGGDLRVKNQYQQHVDLSVRDSYKYVKKDLFIAENKVKIEPTDSYNAINLDEKVDLKTEPCD